MPHPDNPATSVSGSVQHVNDDGSTSTTSFITDDAGNQVQLGDEISEDAQGLLDILGGVMSGQFDHLLEED